MTEEPPEPEYYPEQNITLSSLVIDSMSQDNCAVVREDIFIAFEELRDKFPDVDEIVRLKASNGINVRGNPVTGEVTYFSVWQ